MVPTFVLNILTGQLYKKKKKTTITHWLFIVFGLCQLSTRQSKCRPATVAKTSPTTQDGGFRVGKKYEL